MAYDKTKIFEQAKQLISSNKSVFFIEDIIAYLPLSKPTFYEFYPVESNELNELKELLEKNKVVEKLEIRSKLKKGEKAAELLSLYRLICTNEERQMLNQQYIEHRIESKNITGITFDPE